MSSQLFSNIKLWNFDSPRNSTLGSGTVLIANAVQIRFMVIQGKYGPFASLPSREATNGAVDDNGRKKRYYDIAFPDKETYKEFQAYVVQAWNDKVGQHSQGQAGETSQTSRQSVPDSDPFNDDPFEAASGNPSSDSIPF